MQVRVSVSRQTRAWLVLVLLGAGALEAQSFTVPPSSDVYRRIEAVSAFFPVRGLHLGQRPMSRRELARVLSALERSVEAAVHHSARRAWALTELQRLRAGLGTDDTTAASRVRTAMFGQVHASDARTERIEPNGLGLLDAVTNPFARRRLGWPTAPGVTATVAPTIAVSPLTSLGIVAQPRFSLVGNAGALRGDFEVHRAYVRAVLTNVAVQLGADELLWGQAPAGALFISGNASPAPGLVVGTDTAFTMPWLFRLAGPVRMMGVLADLGPSQDPPHARLAGWLVSIQPWSRFELGVSVLVQTGGNGGPRATFLERLVDLFPAIDALHPAAADLQISNKIAGGNLRIRFPELSGLDVYYELAIDDFDGRRLKSSFIDDMGHLLGARVAGGPVVWRAEYHKTSLRLYEHAQFRSGTTYRRHLIGSPLGPNARGAYLGAEWDLARNTRAMLTFGDERRDPSQFTVTVSADRDRGFRFIRVTDEPRLRGARASFALERTLPVGALRFAGGYHRAWRTGQPARHEWLGQVSVLTHAVPSF